jgi:hypothetical protein
VEWFAGQITDPVHRLKFLKLVARPAEPVSEVKASRRLLRLSPLLLLALPASFLLIRASARVEPTRAPLRRVTSPEVRPEHVPAVWEVEKNGDSETYSNGLRIENRFSVSSRRRSYVAFRAEAVQENASVRRSEPAGIVFHTTESPQAPFEAQQSRVLKRLGQSLLEYVRAKRAYNFLIDRFGRVYRVVAENQVANHAGYSIWSDEKWLYINLNESFLGVSFEAETQPGQLEARVNPVQVRASAILVEMLRSRYAIPARNCVTHGQVSVNPANMRIGYHTDWASSFPFEQSGLPDNYAQPPAAISLFGFEYDSSFLRLAGARMYAGIELAEQTLQDRAVESRLTLPVYRKLLHKNYREKMAALHRESPAKQEESER